MTNLRREALQQVEGNIEVSERVKQTNLRRKGTKTVVEQFNLLQVVQAGQVSGDRREFVVLDVEEEEALEVLHLLWKSLNPSKESADVQ